MLESYEEAIAKLSEVEKQLLYQRIQDLHQVMAPGFDSINWNALGIRDYIDCCVRGIQDFMVNFHAPQIDPTV